MSEIIREQNELIDKLQASLIDSSICASRLFHFFEPISSSISEEYADLENVLRSFASKLENKKQEQKQKDIEFLQTKVRSAELDLGLAEHALERSKNLRDSFREGMERMDDELNKRIREVKIKKYDLSMAQEKLRSREEKVD